MREFKAVITALLHTNQVKHFKDLKRSLKGSLGVLGAGFEIRRSRVQILSPATRWFWVWWSQIQLLHTL